MLNILPILIFALTAIPAAIIACSTTAPAPTALSVAGTASATLDQTVLATKAAYDAGKLSKADAEKALAGFTTAQAGIKAGVAVLSAASAPK